MAEKPDPRKALYVHLAWDGGIFVVEGSSGAEGWVTEAQLVRLLEETGRRGGVLLYSREGPEGDWPQIVARTFQRIVDAGLPVKILAEPHPSVTAASGQGVTTLMGAADAGNEELVADLVGRGVDLEARDHDGYTALMYASNAGQMRSVELLLEAGADPNARDRQGSVPVMFAAQHGDEAIVRALLKAGANPDARGDHGLTALGFARQNGHAGTAAILEHAGGVD